MNGIKMSDCRFYVDEEARVVICVIPYARDLLQDFISDHFSWNDINVEWAINYNFNKKLELPNSFMGKAVCAPEDKWDVETGKMIAFSRAKDKCYKSFFKRANMLVQKFDARLGDMIELFNNFGEKLDKKRVSLQNKIDERVKPVEE